VAARGGTDGTLIGQSWLHSITFRPAITWATANNLKSQLEIVESLIPSKIDFTARSSRAVPRISAALRTGLPSSDSAIAHVHRADFGPHIDRISRPCRNHPAAFIMHGTPPFRVERKSNCLSVEEKSRVGKRIVAIARARAVPRYISGVRRNFVRDHALLRLRVWAIPNVPSA